MSADIVGLLLKQHRDEGRRTMQGIELSTMPDLIPRLLSNGILRRADSHREPTVERKRVEWVSSIYLTRLLDSRVRESNIEQPDDRSV